MNPMRSLVLLLLFVLPAAFSAAAERQLYTCGMHPQIIKEEPGNCPICGMALTPIKSGGAAHAGAEAIHIDPVTVQRMNLKTDFVGRGPVRREIRNVGVVAYDENRLREVSTKYPGWVEAQQVAEIGAVVHAGDPLFEIYSPELYRAQGDYVAALAGEGGAGSLLAAAALGRLRLFDVDEAFIAELARTGEPRRTYTYRAPVAGVVVEKRVVAGERVEAGAPLYRLADLSRVWVLVQVFEDDLPLVREGLAGTVRLTGGRGAEIAATVDRLLPEVAERTRTGGARLVVANAGGALRPGMFVDVRFSVQLAADAVLVPESAVLRSGDRNTVFVARDDGTFLPRVIRIGLRDRDGSFEVLDGLAAGERVVTSGQFLLDSESQLQEAIRKMLRVSEEKAAMAKKPAPAMPMDDSRAAALTGLAQALADAADRLGHDDFAGYAAHRAGLISAADAYLATGADEPLAAAKRRLATADVADHDALRAAFAVFSTEVVDRARAADVVRGAELHVFECPMAPEVGHGRWLQRSAGLLNPFFGSAMATCGEELSPSPTRADRPSSKVLAE